MKGNRWFILFVLTVLGVTFVVEQQIPKKFVWIPTFSRYDKQPFGCMVFDSVLSASLPAGYKVEDKTLYQLAHEDTVTKRGILVAASDVQLSSVDVQELLKLAERGNKVMLVSLSFGRELQDTLKFFSTYNRYRLRDLQKQLLSGLVKRDTVYWVGDSAVYTPRPFVFQAKLRSTTFLRYDSLPARTLVEENFITGIHYSVSGLAGESYRNYHPCLAFVRPWGQGQIILVATPLLFTNYGMLDGQNAAYLFRLLSQMGELPIVRTEAYVPARSAIKGESQSPFRYLLSQPPLRWALYVAMLTIVCFMFFTARRRQRAMPILRQPDNKSIEFIELIGTLYCQQKNHADLIRKKYLYFAEELRREIQVDLEDKSNEGATLERIAQKTGMTLEDIQMFVRNVRPYLSEGSVASDREMKRMIDSMNEIINHL